MMRSVRCAADACSHAVPSQPEYACGGVLPAATPQQGTGCGRFFCAQDWLKPNHALR
jgi:hypothetical protein